MKFIRKENNNYHFDIIDGAHLIIEEHRLDLIKDKLWTPRN